MNLLKNINKKTVSLILSYLTISAYIVLGNCLTYNFFGDRLPLKVAEIVAFISCIILIILHKKDVLKIGKDNIKILVWFLIATIPIFLYGYSVKQMVYGILYSARIIATLAVAIVITNVFKKYEVSVDKICKYFINNYLIVCVIGIIQYIFVPMAFDWYNLFDRIGIYWPNPDPHVQRLLSTYFDPNFLAACLITPAILSVSIFSKTGSKEYFVKTAVFIVTIVLTVSRSGVCGLCMAMFVYAICTLNKKDIVEKKIFKNKEVMRTFFMLIVTVVIFVILTLFSNVRVFQRILNTMDDPSTSARFADWSRIADLKVNGEDSENSDKCISDKDVNVFYGIGYNMIGFTEANAEKPSSASFGNDSSLILIYISSGIIGSLYFIYLVFDRLKSNYINRFKYKNNISLIAIVVTLLVVCNFNNVLFYILWLFPIFILINLDKEEIEEGKNNND